MILRTVLGRTAVIVGTAAVYSHFHHASIVKAALMQHTKQHVASDAEMRKTCNSDLELAQAHVCAGWLKPAMRERVRLEDQRLATPQEVGAEGSEKLKEEKLRFDPDEAPQMPSFHTRAKAYCEAKSLRVISLFTGRMWKPNELEAEYDRLLSSEPQTREEEVLRQRKLHVRDCEWFVLSGFERLPDNAGR
jgi:hypothetical protein